MTDTATKPPAPPSDLKKIGRKDGPGRALWKSIVGTNADSVKYILRADELQILAEACREVDLIADIDEEFRKDLRGFVVKGSTGQPTSNPLIQELRQHRQVLANLLSKLKLPDDVGEQTSRGESTRSSQARDAAAERWGKSG